MTNRYNYVPSCSMLLEFNNLINRKFSTTFIDQDIACYTLF
uniref:Uncharacterized protein n=1 Tax=Anguilla anguilla TaxID=7936 RepID=A0A0E9U5L7_ANGAN